MGEMIRASGRGDGGRGGVPTPGIWFAIGSLVSLPLAVPHVLHAQTQPVRLDTLSVQVGSRVSPELPAMTRSIQLIDREEIEILPVRNVSDLLRWATSVEVEARSPAQSDIGVRGAGFERVVVLVNGIRMSDPQTGHFDLDLSVPLDMVERVEILRGPASALYGADAVGGVVNVVTRDRVGAWSGRIEGGTWGTVRASATAGAAREGGGALNIGGELSRSDGHREGTDHESALIHMRLAQPLGGGRLTGDLGAARRDFGAQDFYAPYPSYEETRTYTGAVRWSRARGEGVGLEVGTSFRRHEDEFTLIREDPEVYQNRHTSSQAGADILARHRLRTGFDLAMGAELFRDFLRSNSLGDRDEDRAAVFGEVVMGGEGPGVLSLGIRQDWHEGFGAFLAPSLSGSIRIGPRIRTRASVGRSFRAPTWTERYYQDPVNVGREDLEPERAWSGEVGLDVATGPDLQLSMTVFARKSEDLIDWAKGAQADPDSPWETRNVEEATTKGVEAELEVLGPLDTRWTVGGMLLSMESEEARGFLSKYALRPLEEQLNVGVVRSFGEAISLGLNLQRGKRKGEDPYHRLDLRGGARLGQSWLYVDVSNLLEVEYPDITGAMAPGRAIHLGLELGFGGTDRG